MKLGMGPTLTRFIAAAAMCFFCVVLASGQAATQEKPLMSDQVFKNVQVLKGIPVDEFMGTMGFFAAALSLNCTECHTADAIDDLSQYATDTPLKQSARRMVLMVRAINQNYFGAKPVVTCYTCHRTSSKPKNIVSLVEQYNTPIDDPNEVELETNPTPGLPTPDQIFDKYIKALGGAQKLATITSYAAKGSYEGFDTSDEKVPLEVYAKAPSQSTIIIHAKLGDVIKTFDGRSGWNAQVHGLYPLLPLSGGDLDGAKFDASLFFPAGIKQYLTDWRSSLPKHGDRRSPRASRSGNDGQQNSDKAVFRCAIRPAGARGALQAYSGRLHTHPSGLLGLSRRFRREGALPLGDDLDRWKVDCRSDPSAVESPCGCVEVQQAQRELDFGGKGTHRNNRTAPLNSPVGGICLGE